MNNNSDLHQECCSSSTELPPNHQKQKRLRRLLPQNSKENNSAWKNESASIIAEENSQSQMPSTFAIKNQASTGRAVSKDLPPKGQAQFSASTDTAIKENHAKRTQNSCSKTVKDNHLFIET